MSQLHEIKLDFFLVVAENYGFSIIRLAIISGPRVPLLA